MNQPLLPTQIRTLAVGFAPDLSLRAIACLRYEPGTPKSEAQRLEAIPADAKGTGAAFSAFAYFLVTLRISQLAGNLSETAIISGTANSPASSLYNSFQKNSAWRNRLFGSVSTERRFRDRAMRFKKPTPGDPKFSVYLTSDYPILIRIFIVPDKVEQISNESLDAELEARFLLKALANLIANVQQAPHRRKPSTFIWQGHTVPENIVGLISAVQNRERYPSVKITVNRSEGAPRQFNIHSGNYPIPFLHKTDELSITVEHHLKAYFCIFWISWDGQSALQLAKIYPSPDEDFPPNPPQGLFEIEFECLSDAAGSSVKIPTGPGFPVEVTSGLESCLIFSSQKAFESHNLTDLRTRINSILKRHPPTRWSLPGSYSEKSGTDHLDTLTESLFLVPRVGHPQKQTPWSDSITANIDLTSLEIKSVQMLSMQVKPC